MSEEDKGGVLSRKEDTHRIMRILIGVIGRHYPGTLEEKRRLTETIIEMVEMAEGNSKWAKELIRILDEAEKT